MKFYTNFWADLGTLSAGLKVLEDFGVPFVVRITSAHRTPHHMMLFAAEMNKSGCKVIIAAGKLSPFIICDFPSRLRKRDINSTTMCSHHLLISLIPNYADL